MRNLPRKLARLREKRIHPSTIIVLVSYALVGVLVIGGIGALVSALIAERTRADGNQAVIQSLRDRIVAKDDDLSSLLDQYAKLYDDCDQVAECVSTAPAPEIIERVLPVEGAQGEQGEPGRAPTSDEIDSAIVRYCLLTATCRGEVGAAGSPGASGTNGADGATVVGPQGEPGATGADGSPGANGQPPVSWTYTDALGFERTCARVEDFDAESPRYTCS